MMARLITLIRKHSVIFCLYVLYFALVAFVLRYPTSADLFLVPLDPNFPLHALAGLDLSDGGSGFVNTRLEFPDGAPIRYLGFTPTVLCMFEGSINPVAAFHLGILAWLTLQGVMMVYLFHDFLEDRLRALIASTLALCTPQILIALGNAQFENVAPAFLLLIAWSIERKQYKWLLFGLIGSCFSSPYMVLGFVAGT